MVCHDCELISRAPASAGHTRCPRCGAPLHTRKPNSLARTWALLIAAAILYIPANVLPVIRQMQGAGVTSLAALATALNNRGIPTARGGTWHPMTVRNLMERGAGK